MATKWTSPVWRMPENSNQSKLDNYSLDFNGSDEFVDLGTSILPRFSSTGNGNTEPWTVSLWANFTTGAEEPLIQFPFGVSVYTWYLFHSTKISFGQRNGAALCTETNSTAVNSNQWNHIVVAFDGVDITAISSFKLYINGVNISITTRGHFGDNIVNKIEIGRGFGSLYYEGKISQCSLFDYKLSETQVKYLYNDNDTVNPTVANPQNPMAITGPTPIAYYPLGQSATGDDNTLTTPNESGSGDTVFKGDYNEYIDTSFSTPAGSKTISIWFKIDTASGYQGLFFGSNTSSSISIGAATTFVADIGLSWFANYTGVKQHIALTTGVTAYQDGKWHNMVYVYDGSTKLIYIDGQSQSITYRSGSGYSTDTSLDLNFENIKLGSNFLTGATDVLISNAQIWDTSLSATEITTLYNGGRPYTGTQPQATNLKYWWKLDVDTSTWNGSDWLIENSISTYNKSFSLSNNGNYINFGDTFFDSYIQTGEDYPVGTISFWVKSRSTQTGYVYIRAIQLAANFSWDIKFFKDDVIGFVTGSGGNYRSWNLHTSLTDNSWHHFALVLPSGTDKTLSKMYMDSQELSVSVPGGAGAAGTYSMSWLRAGNSAWLDYSNIQFYNTALSGNDVSTLYNGGVPLVEASLNPSNLKGWWKMDNTATFSTNWNIPDASGNNNPGVSLGLTESSRVDGLVSVAAKSTGMTTANLVTSDLNRSLLYSSYSMVFDGTDKINLPDIPFLRGGGQKFSVSAWVNTTSGTQVAYFGSRVAPSSTNTIYFYRNTGGGVVFAINSSSTGNIEARSSVTIPNNEWHHVAATFDGTESVANDRIKIYVDGVPSVGYNSGTGTNLPSGTSGIFNFIGALNVGLNQTGNMSNVAIWDSSLSENDILTIYNGGAPNDISSLSPVGWWSLSGDSYFASNWIFPDLSANSNNGTGDGLPATALVGNAPGSTSNGTGTSMNIPGNLEGNSPNSDKNAISINMVSTNRDTSVPDISS